MSLRTTFFALTYDRQMAGTEKAGLRAFRERLLAGAAGDVLEIGAGTGANLPCYGPALGSLTLTEPQPPVLRRLERAARGAAARTPWSCAPRPRTSRSATTASTWRSMVRLHAAILANASRIRNHSSYWPAVAFSITG